jgi:hypothetical protein
MGNRRKQRSRVLRHGALVALSARRMLAGLLPRFLLVAVAGTGLLMGLASGGDDVSMLRSGSAQDSLFRAVSMVVAWGPGMLLGMALVRAHSLRNAQDELSRFLAQFGLSPGEMALGAGVAVATILAVTLYGAVLLSGFGALLSGDAEVDAWNAWTLSALVGHGVFALSYGVVVASLCMALLADEQRRGGGVLLGLVIVLPEFLARSVSNEVADDPLVPASIPSALGALRDVWSPSGPSWFEGARAFGFLLVVVTMAMVVGGFRMRQDRLRGAAS